MRRRPSTALTAALLAGATTFGLAACSASSGGSGGSTSGGSSSSSDTSAGGGSSQTSSAAPACSPATLKTQAANTLTVATDSPAYEPWFVDNKPANGKGFESAVAFAIAKQLGYQPSQVKWVVAPFNSAIAPTPKRFDFDVNEVSITAARAKAVDFSSGYYDVSQAVLVLKKSKYAKAKTLADLKGARLGAQKGTTSLNAIIGQIKPGTSPREFPTSDLAVQALKNGSIDGLVADFDTGLTITAVEAPNSTIIGQLPSPGKPEQFGAVLDKGSPLTACVSKAVDALRADGTLEQLRAKWLTDSAGAPELK